IEHIRQLEQTLTTAVMTTASSLASQLQIAEPNSLFAMGNDRVRGFEPDDYGIVFDVDVPTLLQSVLWSREQMLQLELADLRKGIAMSRDEDAKRFAQQRVNRIEQMLGLTATPQAGPQPAAQGLVTAQATDV